MKMELSWNESKRLYFAPYHGPIKRQYRAPEQNFLYDDGFLLLKRYEGLLAILGLG